jgi:hypothetical protein
MIKEDPNLYLADFGETVIIGSKRGKGILDSPGQMIIGDTVMMMDYSITVPASLAEGVKFGTSVIHDGISYKTKEVYPHQDGVFYVITLEKV